jgi:hypothetical protein
MVLLSSGQAPTSGESRVPVSTKLRQVLLTGAALTIPLLITVMILAFVVNFMLRTIRPAVTFVTARYGLGADLPSYLMETLAVFTLVALVFVVGLVADTDYCRLFPDCADPGVGAYRSIATIIRMRRGRATNSNGCSTPRWRGSPVSARSTPVSTR